jgi:hypothetical protein
MTRTPGPRDPEQSFGDEASIKADRHRAGPDTAGSETRLIGKKPRPSAVPFAATRDLVSANERLRHELVPRRFM